MIPTDVEILVRNDSAITDVNQRQRLVDLIAVPWDQEADVHWRGDMWRESFQRGAFDGIEEHAGRVRANREHVKGDTVGRAVMFDPSHPVGLLTRLKIVASARGDETLALAEEDMISASIGYYFKAPSDVVLNKRTMTRRVTRAFLDHLGLVESPTWTDARVLAVRAEQSGLVTAETPLPPTPLMDAFLDDPVLQWAASRVNRQH